MTVERFDYSKLKAQRTDEGYIVDSPVVSRIGIFEYLNTDGTTRRELRLPEEVFSEDSLKSMKGKPVTSLHKGKITSKNVNAVSIGTILSEGQKRSDSELAADIVIHRPEDIGDMRELSLGYTCDLDEKPGIWQNENYDAIQRNIRYNHLSVVPRGRAGAVARLNMDGSEIQIDNTEGTPMTKLRLDNGIEYEAAPEIAVAFSKLNQDLADLKVKQEADKAKIDGLQARVDSLPAELEKARQDAELLVKQRFDLEQTAKSFKVDCAGKSDNEIMVAVIKTADSNFKEDGKADAYIKARYDVTVEMREDEKMAQQRKSGQRVDNKDDTKQVVKTSKQRYDEQMAGLLTKSAE